MTAKKPKPDPSKHSSSLKQELELLNSELKTRRQYKPGNQKYDPDQEKKKVLVAEDDESLRNRISEWLSSGWIVFEAADGREALELSIKYIPDIIIADVMMEEMSGEELCSELSDREDTCHIPILVISGREEKPLFGDLWLQKPFGREKIQQTLASIA